MIRVTNCGWYYGNGAEIEDAVLDALVWFGKRYGERANFVQLCKEDRERLDGRIRGLTVLEREMCVERGNFMVGRIERV